MSLQRSTILIQVNQNLTMKSTSNKSQQLTPFCRTWTSEGCTTLLEQPRNKRSEKRASSIMITRRRIKEHTLTTVVQGASIIALKVSSLLTNGSVPRRTTIITTSSTRTQEMSGIRTQLTLSEVISTRLAHQSSSRRAQGLTKMSTERIHLAPLRHSKCTSDLGISSQDWF